MSREADFAVVRGRIGSLTSNGGIAELIRKLERENISQQDYLAWLSDQSLEEVAATNPAMALDKLKATPFDRLGSLTEVMGEMNSSISPLFLTEDGGRQFFVVPSPDVLLTEPLSEPSTGSGNASTELSTAPSKAHPLFVAIQTDENQIGTGAIGESGLDPPRYALPVGRLCWRERDDAGANTVPRDAYNSTNYAIVVDVTSPERSVWLIHSRSESELDGFTDEDPADEDALFPGIEGPNFDTAQILSTMAEWNASGSMSSGGNISGLIQTTGRRSAVSARAVARSEVDRALI